MGNEKVNILVILPTAILGGAERVMFNLVSYLVDEGYKVTVYAMSRGQQPGWELLEGHQNCHVFFKKYSSEKKSLLAFFWHIYKLSKINRFDYILSTHTHVNAVLSFLRKTKIINCSNLIGRESTFIFERFFGVKRRIFYFLYRFFYGQHDLLICQTPKMQQSLIESLGFLPAKKILSIPNPVNIKNIRESLNASSPNISSNAINIVVCGRLIPIKGVHMLIEAISLVSLKNKKIRVFIIGDGPERKSLKKLTSDLKLEDLITFVGRIDNPIPWFKVADIGIISSEREGFPNVLIEMMASGTKNIISTPCSDGVLELPGIYVLRKYGLDEMVDAINQVVQMDSDHSDIYLRYIEEYRTVRVFWEKIQQATTV